MARRTRLDAEVARRGLARSRTQATELIIARRVSVDGLVMSKPATQVDPAQAIVVSTDSHDDYASRGAHKLIGALEAFPDVDPIGRVCLDAGASTGGFTDVLLRHGATMVWAVDVGYGQLAWRLREDPRVRVRERTNIRYMKNGDLDPEPTLVVGDLSFISLTTVLPALIDVSSDDSDLLLMVKPQFEVGKAHLPKGGVVHDPAQRAEAVAAVAARAVQLGLSIRGVARSPLPGPSGNVEFFLRLDHSGKGLEADEYVAAITDEALIDANSTGGSDGIEVAT